MHIYPGQMYPLQIEPRATEPNYTKAVSDLAQYTYTQVRCTPQSNPELQSPITPNQFPL